METQGGLEDAMFWYHMDQLITYSFIYLLTYFKGDLHFGTSCCFQQKKKTPPCGRLERTDYKICPGVALYRVT